MSRHFSEREMCASARAAELGLLNQCPPELKENLAQTMAGLERVRAYVGLPIKVLSGYRCEALNKAVGGSKNSQHMRAQAVDIVCPGYGTPRRLAASLSTVMDILGIDQIILEGSWVHLSFTALPRYEALTFDGTKYLLGIV